MSGIPIAMSRPVPLKRFRLGAEELIEMGDSRRPVPKGHKPFLGSRARPALGAEELIEMGQGTPAASPNVGTWIAVGVVAGVAALAFLA